MNVWDVLRVAIDLHSSGQPYFLSGLLIEIGIIGFSLPYFLCVGGYIVYRSLRVVGVVIVGFVVCGWTERCISEIKFPLPLQLLQIFILFIIDLYNED